MLLEKKGGENTYSNRQFIQIDLSTDNVNISVDCIVNTRTASD